MNMNEIDTVSPNYDPKGSYELTEPTRWWQILHHFRGIDLIVVGITVIAVFGKSNLNLSILSIVCLTLLGLACIAKYIYAKNTKQYDKKAIKP